MKIRVMVDWPKVELDILETQAAIQRRSNVDFGLMRYLKSFCENLSFDPMEVVEVEDPELHDNGSLIEDDEQIYRSSFVVEVKRRIKTVDDLLKEIEVKDSQIRGLKDKIEELERKGPGRIAFTERPL